MSLLDGNADLTQKLRKSTEYLQQLRGQVLGMDQTVEEISDYSHKLSLSKHHLSIEKEGLEKDLDSLLSHYQDLNIANQDLIRRMMDMKEDQISKMNEMIDLERSFKNKEIELNDLELSMKANSFISDYNMLDVDDFDSAKYTSLYKPMKAPRKKVYYLQGHEVEGTLLVYNNSGSCFLTSGNENMIKMWDSCSCLEKQSLRGFLQSIVSICVSPTDDLVLGGSSNFSAYLWNTLSTKLKHTLTGHCGKITGVGFLRSNIEAVTVSEDKTVKIWSLDKGYCLNTIGTASTIYALAVDNNTHVIITGHKDGAVRIHTAKSKRGVKNLAVQRSSISGLSLSPCGNYLGIATRDHAVIVKDLRMGEQLWKLTHKQYMCPGIRTLGGFSSDSRMLSVGSFNGDVLTWNVTDGNIESVVSGWHNKPVLAVQWSSCDNQVGSIDSGGFIGVWA